MANIRQDLDEEKSTTDQILTVKNLLEKAWEHNVEIHQIFIDFQKAYDSIRRDKLYLIMEFFGIPNKLIRLKKKSNHGGFNLQPKDRNNYG